jgi:hypothetical protein
VTDIRKGSAELRRFGLVVGTGFACVGAFWIWRGKFAHVSPVFVGIGALLLAAAAIAPRTLALPHRAWMALGDRLGVVMTHVILFILFFAVVTPIAVVLRLAGRDLLGRREKSRSSYWTDYSPRQRDRRHYEKMY